MSVTKAALLTLLHAVPDEACDVLGSKRHNYFNNSIFFARDK
jgi:hypothetical protein